MTHRPAWLATGLALVTCATLLVEILCTRLLSVLTWYHLSFLAVTLAMLGMASGAVFVFLRGDAWRGAGTNPALTRAALAMAAAIALSHLVTLTIPIPPLTEARLSLVLPLAVVVTVLGVPFFFSGIAVTLALTRSGGPVGWLYAWDLAGAAAGCLLVIPLLVLTNLSTAMLTAAAATAAGAWCFARAAGRRPVAPLLLAGVLLAAAAWNGRTDALTILYPKNQRLWLTADDASHRAWTTHAYVVLGRPYEGQVYLWGPGRGAERFTAVQQWLTLDGEAATPMTRWDGRVESLDWVPYDVTSLPYRLRAGRAAVVGVGGGRDLLTALWGGSTSVTGIEINRELVELLEGPCREFAGLAGHPRVRLVNDEARSWLARRHERFDVIQMSLIDTWAATGAGAFTLSENGLYTVEGWRIFLDSLTPDGVFSVSRWFSPTRASETSRLASLAVAAVLGQGAARPRDHLVLAASGNVATLLVAARPFDDEDRRRLDAAIAEAGFRLLAAPWQAAEDPQLAAILAAGSRAGLAQAATDPLYDYSPPTDERPFFFNMLRPSSLGALDEVPRGGVAGGNLRATATLFLLLALTLLLVAAIILFPLGRSGLPGMQPRAFAISLAYFAMIGMGFMLIQIPFLQRFSVYLGHPTWTLAVVLFGMILFTGAGSALSDRIPADARWLPLLPLTIAALLVVDVVALQRVIDATTTWGLAGRTAVVLAVIAPLAVLLGFGFPVGIRLVGSMSDLATAWMWGVNGATGVLASVAVISISMWFGIHLNLWIAAATYLALTAVLVALQRHARAGASAPCLPT